MSNIKYLVRALTDERLTVSVSEARRLIAQGAVMVDDQKESDLSRVLLPGEYRIKVGISSPREIIITVKE